MAKVFGWCAICVLTIFWWVYCFLDGAFILGLSDEDLSWFINLEWFSLLLVLSHFFEQVEKEVAEKMVCSLLDVFLRIIFQLIYMIVGKIVWVTAWFINNYLFLFPGTGWLIFFNSEVHICWSKWKFWDNLWRSWPSLFSSPLIVFCPTLQPDNGIRARLLRVSAVCQGAALYIVVLAWLSALNKRRLVNSFDIFLILVIFPLGIRWCVFSLILLT